jgi:catechol 2,3-dioxygenase-like lactoylglutathione lyase family enzyme
MKNTPVLDHIALTVPDLDALIARLTSAFGMVVELHKGEFAIVADPATGMKLELGKSADSGVHFRHFGFRAEDVDAAHAALTAAGMLESTAPNRSAFARMYTSFLKQPDGFEVQLVKYD